MLSERDIELAHPEAFDFVFGNMFPAGRTIFDRHLAGCRYCQGVVAEYGEIGRIIKSLPPHVEPPPGLEDRTVAAMVAALAGQEATTGRRPDAEDRADAGDRADAEDRAANRVFPISVARPDEPEIDEPELGEPETLVQPRLRVQPQAEDDTRLPAWRRYRGRLLAVAVAIAAII